MFSQFLVETEILETDPPVNSPKSSKCSTDYSSSEGNRVGFKCQSDCTVESSATTISTSPQVVLIASDIFICLKLKMCLNRSRILEFEYDVLITQV